MSSLGELDHRHLWHPFTQQRGWEREQPLVIAAAEGTDLIDVDGRRYIDGVSSLWCNVHGHRHPLIDQAIRDQLDRVAHSTLLGLTHAPAVELAGRLVDLAPPGLTRVFYSDSGSTAVEIALKMAFQYWRQRGGEHADRTSFVNLAGGYHGDTVRIGLGRGHRPLPLRLRAAAVRRPSGAAGRRRRPRSDSRGQRGSRSPAVIVEPLVQGAAGIRTQPPGYLRALRGSATSTGSS